MIIVAGIRQFRTRSTSRLTRVPTRPHHTRCKPTGLVPQVVTTSSTIIMSGIRRLPLVYLAITRTITSKCVRAMVTMGTANTSRSRCSMRRALPLQTLATTTQLDGKHLVVSETACSSLGRRQSRSHRGPQSATSLFLLPSVVDTTQLLRTLSMLVRACLKTITPAHSQIGTIARSLT